MMDYMNYKVLSNGVSAPPSDSPLPIELSRMQMEITRRDAIIEEQTKRIFQLEDEVKRCNKQIQDLVVQLAQFKDQKPKQDNYKPVQSRYWTAEEHDRFLDAIKRFGPKDVKAIASYVGTRNPTQVRTHAQKYYLRLERERKRREEAEKGGGSIDDVPQSPLDDSGSSQQTTPTNNEGPHSDDDLEKSESAEKKNPRKRASTAGRRASMPADIASIHMKHEPPSMPPVPNNMNANNTVVHSTKQQLQMAGPIVSSLKGWSHHEYNLFIEGLLSFPEEKDINRKCKLISEKFLPKYSPEDIKQCYAILHNYVRNRESVSPTGNPLADHDYMDPNKRLKPNLPEGSGMPHGYGLPPSYTTTGLPPGTDMHSLSMRNYGMPYQNQMRGFPPPYASGYPAMSPAMSPSYMPPGVNEMPSSQAFNEAAMIRRASYPMDTFSLNKTYADAISENIFPAEFPNWNNEGNQNNNPNAPDDIQNDNNRNGNL